MISKINNLILKEIDIYLAKNRLSKKEFCKKAELNYNSFINLRSKLKGDKGFPSMTTLKKIEKDS